MCIPSFDPYIVAHVDVYIYTYTQFLLKVLAQDIPGHVYLIMFCPKRTNALPPDAPSRAQGTNIWAVVPVGQPSARPMGTLLRSSLLPGALEMQ